MPTDTAPHPRPGVEAPYGSPYPVAKRIAELTSTRPNLTLVMPGVKLDRRLTPNGRAHWAVKHRILAQHKSAAFYNVKALLGGNEPQSVLKNTAFPVTVSFTRYYSGKAKPFDDDNLRPAYKGYRDGLALALGIKDDPSQMTGQYPQERCKPGEDRLEIRIEF